MVKHGRELWRTDGTAKGTLLLRDLRKGAAGSTFDNSAPAGKYFYFTTPSGEQNAYGYWFSYDNLWRTDGTAKGTIRSSPCMRSIP